MTNLSKKLLLLAILGLSACAGFKITKGEVCKEIPFVDAPEGVCATNTYPVKSRWLPANEWTKFKVEALMISPEFWTEIKKNWLKACRQDDDCVKELETIDSAIQQLNNLGNSVLKP